MYAHTLLLAVATLAQDTAARAVSPLAIAPPASARARLLMPAEASLRIAEARLAAQGPVLAATLMQADAVLRSLPPGGWDAQDPADSLYRAAHQALNRNQHTRAAELFRAVYTRHARSTYAADAYYW
ncbi:MAG: hypothetical protein ACREME_01965, partial [Gemmatimonadales bacterium]